MISEQFQELQNYLQEHKHQGSSIQRRADGSYLITVTGTELPPGWNVNKIDVLFIAPPGYPAAKPDCFWISPPARLLNGAIPQNANEGTPLPYDIAAVPRTWFSWHLQMWNPNRDSLITYYQAIMHRLKPAR